MSDMVKEHLATADKSKVRTNFTVLGSPKKKIILKTTIKSQGHDNAY